MELLGTYILVVIASFILLIMVIQVLEMRKLLREITPKEEPKTESKVIPYPKQKESKKGRVVVRNDRVLWQEERARDE